MSILIKGMKMPKGCTLRCPAVSYRFCPLESVEELSAYRDSGKRHPDCPLIPIPPHGRLIDADALYEGMDAYDYDYYIMDAPTVIPAEDINVPTREAEEGET